MRFDASFLKFQLRAQISDHHSAQKILGRLKFKWLNCVQRKTFSLSMFIIKLSSRQSRPKFYADSSRPYNHHPFSPPAWILSTFSRSKRRNLALKLTKAWKRESLMKLKFSSLVTLILTLEILRPETGTSNSAKYTREHLHFRNFPIY